MVALQQVLCLEEVVRTKSFRSAAQALHMSQPAVSGHIARLERELHLTLLERTPAGSVLTPEGIKMLPHLRAFVESAEVIRRASEFIQATEQRSITLLSNSHGVRRIFPEAIGMLHEQFDNLVVRCGHAEEPEICESLRSGSADLGILVRDTDHPDRAGIVGTELMYIGPAGICGPAGDPLFTETVGPIDAAVMAGKPLILLSHSSNLSFADAIFPPSMRGSVTIVDDPQTAVRLVEAGLGYAMITGGANFARGPRLEWRGLRGSPRATLLLARSRTSELSPPAKLLADFLVDWGRATSNTFHYDATTGRMEPVGDGGHHRHHDRDRDRDRDQGHPGDH